MHLAQSPSRLSHWFRSSLRTQNIVYALSGAFFIAMASQVSQPFGHTGVPFTLQSQAVLLVGAALGPAASLRAVATFLAAGAAGLPAFAGGAGGAWHLVGPTGGYLLSYLLAAPLCGALWQKKKLFQPVGFFAAALVTLVIGTVQLALWVGPKLAFTAGFQPFWAVDVLKASLAYLVAWCALGRKASP